MCDGGAGDSGGDVICYDDGGVVCGPGGSDGSWGCCLKGCLAVVLDFFALFIILPAVYKAVINWMQENITEKAYDYRLLIMGVLIVVIFAALYFLSRFIKFLYQELDKLLHTRF